MITAKASTLSLEEGLRHLSQLLSGSTEYPFSGAKRLQVDESITRLESLLPGGALHEAWKYTPLTPFKLPWEQATVQLGEGSELASAFTLFELETTSDSLALEVLPAPRSPWEVLIPRAATAVNHFRLAQSGHYSLAVQARQPLGVAPAFYTFLIPAEVEAHLWLSTAIHPESLTLLRLHFHLGPHSRLHVYYVNTAQAQSEGALLVVSSAHVAEGAQFHGLQALRDYQWLRFETTARLAGPEAEAHLYGLADPTRDQVHDTAIRIEHAAPHTHSNQLFRSITYKGGRRVFLGRIYVDRTAQKTNAYQSHKAILWEPGAEVYSRPQLEIFADDVRCTHGATTGFLQGDALFYLQARGIPRELARRLVARGFLAEALTTVPSEPMQEALLSRFFPL